MKKTLLILVLSMLVISFGGCVQVGHSLTVGPAVHQGEDWKAEYDKLKAEYDKLINIIVPQVEVLGSRLDEMRTEIETLRSELEASKVEYSSLDIKYSSLNIKYETAVRDLNTRTTMMYAFIVTTVVFLATTLYLAFRKART